MAQIYLYVANIHELENAWKILWTQLKKRKWSSWKTRRYARFVSAEENGAYSKTIGKRPGSTCACLVNSCQGKDAGVLFRQNYSIHQHTGIGCNTSS